VKMNSNTDLTRRLFKLNLRALIAAQSGNHSILTPVNTGSSFSKWNRVSRLQGHQA
jgi:hypothetical protein